MKHAIRFCFLFTLCLLVSACSGEDDSTPSEKPSDDDDNTEDEDGDNNPSDDDDDDNDDDNDDSEETPQAGTEHEDDFGVTWIYIPAGVFQMGCSPRDENCVADERPVHEVTLDGFWMMRTEATQALYAQQTGENPSTFSACDTCPVESISHSQAQDFCESLEARLPSESQWEYAARAGTDSIRLCGDDEACLPQIAWYDDNSESQTQDVAQLQANDFGLFDMQGNVWEWTQDCYQPTFNEAPTDGSALLREGCTRRVARGGSWYLYARRMRISNRLEQAADEPGDYLGVRCVKASF